jgi:hypothetical protein
MNKKGQTAGIVMGAIAIIIGIILLVGVALPIVQDTVASQNLTGVSKTIGDNLGVFILIASLLLIVGAGFAGFMARK